MCFGCDGLIRIYLHPNVTRPLSVQPRVPDLKSCSAFGDTPEEAVAEVRVAMEAWLAAAREAGHPIPEARYRPHHEAAE